MAFFFYTVVFVKDKETVTMKNDLVLPAPQTDSPFTLMNALETRRTTRKWNGEAVSEQDLSNLLWAACGITKEKKGNTKSKRTALRRATPRKYVNTPAGKN